MRKKAVYVLLIFCLLPLFSHNLSAQQNPFISPPPQSEEKKQEKSFTSGDFLPEKLKYAGQKAIALIIAWQAQIRQKSGAYARQIRENPWGTAFWSYLGLAFAYGVIHALGPGHGKVFVSTYFLSRKASVRQGVLMGAMTSSLHVISAVILVMVLYFVVKSGGLGSVDHAGRHLQKISAGLICIVGLFLIFKSGRAFFYPDNKSSCSCVSETDNKSLLSLSLAVGMVPCPGAALILFFSITLDIIFAGIIAMVFIAAGLALTTISFALVSLFTRNILAKLPTGRLSVNPRLYHLPAMIGAIFISIVGMVLYFNPAP